VSYGILPLKASGWAELVSSHTQHVHTQEEGRAPVVEACESSAGVFVKGPAVGPSGCSVADAFVSPSDASPELLVVGCNVGS
jgi:hypothetical protein